MWPLYSGAVHMRSKARHTFSLLKLDTKPDETGTHALEKILDEGFTWALFLCNAG
jgi:hypothetical protein